MVYSYRLINHPYIDKFDMNERGKKNESLLLNIANYDWGKTRMTIVLVYHFIVMNRLVIAVSN